MSRGPQLVSAIPRIAVNIRKFVWPQSIQGQADWPFEATKELTQQGVIVIGGLAVICRLSTAYRATTDLDIVDRHDDAKEPQLHILLARTQRPSGPSGTIVSTPLGDIQVDVIEVSDSDIAQIPEDPTGRLYVLAHARAAETATPVIIRAQQSDEIAVLHTSDTRGR